MAGGAHRRRLDDRGDDAVDPRRPGPRWATTSFPACRPRDWVAVLVGCAASAGLALTVDGLLGLIEGGVARRDGKRLWAGGAGLLIGLLAALAPRPARRCRAASRPM
ncbi:hypothetical protein ACRAWD_06225 [Caulobacter segnis]